MMEYIVVKDKFENQHLVPLENISYVKETVNELVKSCQDGCTLIFLKDGNLVPCTATITEICQILGATR